ncbi:hypothetical protein MATL_G00247730 [Megalops atlanticus]|uniref:Uncharacterized protein n=1 Tax=Megalops atlanticus TaxID=7932 RepID=A0A9D3PB60_MEGAT|nr:hypothetical protein MATL_G00247730 [Megalops atlanticus]
MPENTEKRDSVQLRAGCKKRQEPFPSQQQEHVRSQEPDSETLRPFLLPPLNLPSSADLHLFLPVDMQAPCGRDVIKIDGYPAVDSGYPNQH